MSKRESSDPKAVRTTISLNPTVYQWAVELMRSGGHNSLSDLLADLIRRKKEDTDRAPNGGSLPQKKNAA